MKLASIEKVEKMLKAIAQTNSGKLFIEDSTYSLVFGGDEEFEAIKENCEFVISKVNEDMARVDMEISDILNLK